MYIHSIYGWMDGLVFSSISEASCGTVRTIIVALLAEFATVIIVVVVGRCSRGGLSIGASA